MSASDSSRGPRSPRELLSVFAERVNTRDLEALVALYEPQAVFVPAPGVVHHGHAAIRGALAELLSLAPVMQTEVKEVYEEGDTALAVVEWSLRGTAPDGSAVVQGGKSADVLRRRADGTWRVSIDHP